ncbi:hypothetical protein TNCV_766631 [Trichonephila clavipes]|nr:hypothetical protein TNCV_766631 [Trichonephila clavipes]
MIIKVLCGAQKPMQTDKETQEMDGRDEMRWEIEEDGRKSRLLGNKFHKASGRLSFVTGADPPRHDLWTEPGVSCNEFSFFHFASFSVSSSLIGIDLFFPFCT